MGKTPKQPSQAGREFLHSTLYDVGNGVYIETSYVRVTINTWCRGFVCTYMYVCAHMYIHTQYSHPWLPYYTLAGPGHWLARREIATCTMYIYMQVKYT